MNLRPRLPFAALAIGAIVGILASEFHPLPAAWSFAATAVTAIAACCYPRTWTAMLFTCAAFFFLHTLRFLENPVRQLTREFANARTIDIEGVVWDEPRSLPDEASTFLLRATLLGDAPRDAGFVRVRTVGETPACGDRVRIRGTARAPLPPRNPAEFDQTEWSKRQGISLEIRCENAQDSTILARAEGRMAMRAASLARIWVREHLAAGVSLSSDEVTLIESMVLGVNAETPAEMRDLFQKTGTLHLLAVSGLNVAMLAAIILTLLRLLRVGRSAAVAIVIPALAGYALVTGLSPSCVRATIMASFLLAAPCFDRSANALNSLAAAAFALLAWDTNQLFSIGFQLSFVIVLVIFLTARKLHEFVAPWANPDAFIPAELWNPAQKIRVWVWRGFAAAAGVNIASWVGSLVFMAGYFNLISPAAIVANFIAVILAFFILALGLASVISGAFPAIVILFNHANVLCAGSLLTITAAFAKIPHGYFYVEVPKPRPAPACEITVLDMGEGAATHIRSGDSDWLIDTGHIRDYSRTLVPYLRSRGINRLDTLVLTHGDAWHIGAASPLLREFEPLDWIEGRPADRSPTRRALHAELAGHAIGRSLAAAGDSWSVGSGTTLQILFPPMGIDRAAADDQALVVLLTSAGRRILLMSDAGFATEQWLAENMPSLRADVVVKGWHDKESNGGSESFHRVAPRLVIVGEQHFGTPPEKTESWAAALRENGIAVFPQIQTGAVRILIQKDGSIRAAAHLPGTEVFSLPSTAP